MAWRRVRRLHGSVFQISFVSCDSVKSYPKSYAFLLWKNRVQGNKWGRKDVLCKSNGLASCVPLAGLCIPNFIRFLQFCEELSNELRFFTMEKPSSGQY